MLPLSFLSSSLSLLLISGYSALPTSAERISTGGKPKVATAWFTGWHGKNATPVFGVDDVSWEKYTRMTYAFAETTPDPSVLNLTGSNPDLLPSFVEEAHKNNVTAAISIGGWTGSRFWSSSIATPTNRTTFIQTLLSLVSTYNLDGLDFDWEYPNLQGLGCNVLNPNDTSNFLLFLDELRSDPVGSKLELSAAVAIRPFIGPDGVTPLEDVSAFAKHLDYIAIMNYDIWGSWSSAVGPNAPLNDTCVSDPATEQQGSAVSAVKAWNQAGFPLDQIVLGVASYGHSFVVNQTDAFESGSTSELAAYPRFNATAFPAGDSWDDPSGLVDPCGVVQHAGGNYDFWALIEQGLLNEDGSPNPEVPYRFDECSQTAYVYDSTKELMISFDDATAFAAKGNFISNLGLAGFSMWEVGGDLDDILLDSIRSAAGFDDEECEEIYVSQ
ncbi:glycoside hydrolase family 18 protein [Dendrothele bispora CBS 962.96]|uniref:Glycoside hydrolase family 18 protein n=1 Tax=Dendrothele bispora (strain CBS 962.96) TaxID=1314807 RepID=A0A4S8L155_DENBC|nr:glycoside hydrolase family 18 protein [Dendrothele bispora CBS 962.96]